jgi:WD40 repeat protein
MAPTTAAAACSTKVAVGQADTNDKLQGLASALAIHRNSRGSSVGWLLTRTPSPQGALLSSPLKKGGLYRSGRWKLWNLACPNRPDGLLQRAARATNKAQSMSGLKGFVQSPDGWLIACRVTIWALPFRSDNLDYWVWSVANSYQEEVTALAFHPSGRYLAATGNDATVKVHETATWMVAESFNWNIGRLHSVAFSPNGMLAAVGGDKGQIVVFDVDL